MPETRLKFETTKVSNIEYDKSAKSHEIPLCGKLLSNVDFIVC